VLRRHHPRGQRPRLGGRQGHVRVLGARGVRGVPRHRGRADHQEPHQHRRGVRRQRARPGLRQDPPGLRRGGVPVAGHVRVHRQGEGAREERHPAGHERRRLHHALLRHHQRVRVHQRAPPGQEGPQEQFQSRDAGGVRPRVGRLRQREVQGAGQDLPEARGVHGRPGQGHSEVQEEPPRGDRDREGRRRRPPAGAIPWRATNANRRGPPATASAANAARSCCAPGARSTSRSERPSAANAAGASGRCRSPARRKA